MLVGYCRGGKIYNVNVDGNISVATSKQGANHIGGLIGYSTNSSTQKIHNCTVTINSNNKIESVSVANEDGVYAVQNVGGLIGYTFWNSQLLEIVGTKVILNGEISAVGGKTSNTSNLGTNVGGMIGLVGRSQKVQIYSSSVTGTGSIISTSDPSNSGDIDYTHCVGGIVGAISSEGYPNNDSYVTFNNVGVQIGKISTTTENEQSAGEHSGGIVGSNLTSTSFGSLYQAWAIIDNVDESVGLYGIAGEGTELTMGSNGSVTKSVFSNVEPLFPDEWEGYKSEQYGVIDVDSLDVELSGAATESENPKLITLLNQYVSSNTPMYSKYIKWHEDGGNVLLDKMVATPDVEITNNLGVEYTINSGESITFTTDVTFEGGEIGTVTYQWIEYDSNGNNGVEIEGATENTYTVTCFETPKASKYGVIVKNILTAEEQLSDKDVCGSIIIHNPRQKVNLDFDDSYFVSEYLYDGNNHNGLNISEDELRKKAIITDDAGNPITISPDSEGYNYIILWNDRTTTWRFVGEHKLTIQIYNNEYECSYTTTFEIKPVIVYVNVGTYKMNKEYDGTTDAGTVSGELAISYTEGFIGTFEPNITTSPSYKDKNVGENKIVIVTLTITSSKDSFYFLDDSGQPVSEITYEYYVGSITPKTLTPSIGGTLEKEYDGTTQPPEGIEIGLEVIPSDTEDVSATATFTYDNANVGENKTITATNISLIGEDKDNYVLASTTATIDNAVITKADFEGTKQITKKVVYNKARENYTIDLTALLPVGYELSDAIYETNTDDIFDTTAKTIPVIENGAIIVDIASVEIGKTGVIEVTVKSTNYKEYTFEITVNSVDKETVEITGLTIKNKEYNGEPITYTGELSVSGDKVLVSDLIWLYTGTDDTEYSSGDAPVNAGTYKLTVSVPDSNDEYMGSVEYPFKITPRTLTLSYDQSSSKTKEYDGTKNAPQDAKLVLSGLAKETDDVRFVATFTYDDENVGENKTITATNISLIGEDKDNYEVSTTFDITGASITPKPVTLKSATVANRNYIARDRTVVVTAIEFTEDTPVPSFEDNEVTAEAIMDDENAGEGKNVTVSITYIDENYSISSNAREITTTVDIEKIDYDLDMTGTVSPRSNREKTGNEYNLANVLNLPTGYTFGTPTIKDNEDGVLTGTPSVANNVLTYDVASVVAEKTATIEIPVSSTNYNDKNAVITFTVVDKEEVEISGLEFANKEYDGTAITSTGELTVSEPSILVSDLVWLYTGTDDTEYSSANAPVNVGTYKVTISVPESNEDYIGSFSDTFEITAKEITAVFDETSSKTKVYDGTEAGPEGAKVKLEGTVDEEVSATATFTYDNANAETRKTLTATNITLEGNTKDNYTLSTTTLSIEDAIITPKPVKLKSASVENRDYIAGNSTVYVTAIEFNEATPVPSFEDNEVTAEAIMDDENAGEGKNVTVTINYIDTNYSLSVNTITTTVDIAKIAYNKEITGSTSVRENLAKTGAQYVLTGLLNLPEGYTFGTPTYTDNTDGVLTGTPSIENNVLTYDIASVVAGKTGKVQIPVSSTNYTDVNAILTITTVEKEEVEIDGLEFENKVYDGTAITSTGELTVSEPSILVSDLEWLYTGTNNTTYNSAEAPVNVGTYKVTISVPDSNEDYIGSFSDTFEIIAKVITAEFDETSVKTKVYDATTTGPEGAKVKLIGIVDNEVSATATFTYDNANAETGKTLTITNITLEGNTKDNYTLSTTTLSIEDAIITPKPVKLKSASVENRDYVSGDATVKVTAIEFNEDTPVPLFENNEVTAEAKMDDENAGTGKKVTVTINYIDTNYSLSENTMTTTVDIAKITYNKEITGSTSVRGEVAKTGIEYDLTGLLNLPEGYTFGTPTYIDNTDGVLIETPSIANNVLTYDVASVEVGKTGKVQIPVSSTNYTDVNAILTVTTVEKEPLTISGLTYASKEYDGTVVTPTGTLTVTENKVLVEDLDVEYFVFDEEQNKWQLIDELLSTVGQYKVRYSISYSNENYTGEQEYTFDITKKTPTITLGNLTQTVGSVTNVTYTVTPAVTDGTTKVEYKLSTSGDTDYAETLPTEIGTYTVRVSVSGDTNLNDTEKTETFTIKKKQSTGGGGGGGSTTTKYEIKVTQNDGGTISPETLKVEKGDNQTFEIKANEGYEIEDVLVDNVSVGKVSSYTFEKVKEKHTIEAKFKETEEETWKNPFVDVTKDDWFYEAVKYANENKLFNGVSSTEFGPNVSMTRAMLVTVLYRLEGEPATNKSIPFADVDMSSYYASAVIWAKQNNIVNGIDNTNFAPNGEITREQLATILYRYANYKGIDVSVGENTNILSYDDFSELSEYAIPAMQWACGSGIITGRTTSTIAPKGTATRAEVATMLMRFTK